MAQQISGTISSVVYACGQNCYISYWEQMEVWLVHTIGFITLEEAKVMSGEW